MKMKDEKEKTVIMHVAQAAGGVDRYLKGLLKYINREKYINILVCSEDYLEEDYLNLCDSFHTVPFCRDIGFTDMQSLFAVSRLIKEYKPDIVYAHSSKAGAIARMANIFNHNICVYNPHGWAFNMRGSKFKAKIYKYIEKMLAHLCDKIVCISDSEKISAIRNRICSEQKLCRIFNGIDFDEYAKLQEQDIKNDLSIPLDAFVVGMVGRLSEQKSPDVFAQMAVLISKEIKNCFFLYVGDGPMREYVNITMAAHGLENKFFITGWVANPMDYISIFDVAVLLSRWEGFGLAVSEYKLCKKPIVATAVDAIPDQITSMHDGILVPVDNAEMASKAVIQLYNDPELCNYLSQNGYEDVRKRFDIRRVADEHEALFTALMASKKR